MAPSPLVYVEHGAGQTYNDPRLAGHGSYPGGAELDRVRLFVCPNDHVADEWLATYPDCRTVVVGCPFMDRWHGSRELPSNDPPVVAVTGHWDMSTIPETRSAWPHYDRALERLAADDRWTILGHGHPRLWGAIRRRWQELGVDHTPNLGDAFDRADLLIGDNTSAMFEFASLDRPVVVVNAPWYRRGVHHGLRFWDYPPGLQTDLPSQLAPTVARALTDPPEGAWLRRRAVGRVYAHTDGRASQRAAEAIQGVLTV